MGIRGKIQERPCNCLDNPLDGRSGCGKSSALSEATSRRSPVVSCSSVIVSQSWRTAGNIPDNMPNVFLALAEYTHHRLRAIGNSITLKNKYGAGYRISIVTDPARVAETKAVVASRVAGAVLEDDSAGALIYQFPGSSTNAIPEFVKYLDHDPDDLIRAWGISQTTLEEVFLKLIRDANPEGYGSTCDLRLRNSMTCY